MPAERSPATSSHLATRLIERLLPPADAGCLVLTLPNGDRIERRASPPGPQAEASVTRWRCVWRLVTGGDVGFAESYIDGDWTTPDLKTFLEWGMRNERALWQTTQGSLLSRLVKRIRHLRRANTKGGSRKNIAAHYDLGNEFYKRWLDPSMMYSSAFFAEGAQSLEQAQAEKIKRATELLDVKDGEKVLEIGFGWGAVLEWLIDKYRCHVTGLTLSKEQLAYSRERLARVAEKTDLRLQDYRDVEGTFDHIISVEMFEAVGEKYWPVFFDKVRGSLKATGTCVLQAITIAEERFDAYRSNPDFIQRYIFPGGMLPTKEIMRREAERAGLELVTQESFGQSYARTLEEWRRRFIDAWPTIQPLGFDDRFRRMWEYYLAYCEVGFRSASIDVSWFKLAARPA